MNSGIQKMVFLLVGLGLAGCFSVEAASLQRAKSPTKLDLSVLATAANTVVEKVAEPDADSDDDDDDASNDATQEGPQVETKAAAPGGVTTKDEEEQGEEPLYEVEAPAKTAEEVHLAKAEGELAANLREQKELQSKLKHYGDEANSNAEIEASVKLVANQTESVAMADMLGQVWKEMRMFEIPFYAEHVQEELQHLKLHERALEKKVTTDQGAVSATKDEQAKKKHKKEEKKTVAASIEGDTEKADEAEKSNAVNGISANKMTWSFWAMGSSQKKSLLLHSFLYLVSGIIAAYLFKEASKRYPSIFVPQVSKDKFPNSKDFSNHIFGFLGDQNLCILGCFCPCLTWAGTLDRKGLLSYWKAFTAFFVLCLLNAYTMGVSTLCVVILGVFYRQKLRAKYEIENGTLPTVAMDFLLWCCCQPCAIIQEAREDSVTRGSTIEGP